jgi:hypothetical protein
MIRSWRNLAFVLPIVLATACSTSTEDAASGEDDLNYRSTAGQEYSLSTDLVLPMPADIAAMPAGADRDKALSLKADDIRNTVTTAIVAELDKMWPEDARTNGGTGVAVEYRQATPSVKDIKVSDDGKSISFTVSAEFAGEKDLDKKLPMKTEGQKTFFPVPADLGSGATTLEITVTPIERSLNAYPKYLDMFADGLDIYVHVGGDHDTPPQDIAHARSVYDDMLASGFKSPVARFEDLKIDTAPLTSTIKVKDADVQVRVKIVHVDMSTPDTRQILIDAYKAAAKTADVVIYDGHAGRQLTYSGVVVAYNPARVALPASEFKNMDVTDKQQLYLFNGCETYTGYADSLYENPKKNTTNTDVITTGNFSAIQPKANQVLAFIHSLIDQKNGAWIPRSWDSVLGKMNAVGEESWIHVYGVHGIDDDPKASPLADPSKVGVACQSDAECGAADSKCVRVTSTKQVCGIACADSSGCPNGTKCLLPKGKVSSDDMQCLAN